MKNKKKLKGLRFFVVLCVVNGLLSFLLEPVRGSSGTMWEEYYQEEELDTIFMGASFCASSFDPAVFDRELGVKSFNMGTPLQGMRQTKNALQTALKEHEIQTVIIGMGFFVLQEQSVDAAELTFEKAKTRNMGTVSGVLESVRYMFDEEVKNTEKSIQYLFPWLYNKEEVSVKFMTENVTEKIRTWNEKKENLTNVSKKGYRSFLGQVNYADAWEINSYQYYQQQFQESLIKEFEQLLSLCKEAGVDVIVINVPHPAYDVVSCYETYEENEIRVAQICAAYGVDYYNFSLAKPEVFEVEETYFYDFEHLNAEGAEVFSEAVCQFLERRKAGENVRESFYSVKEYLEIQKELLEEWKEVRK